MEIRIENHLDYLYKFTTHARTITNVQNEGTRLTPLNVARERRGTTKTSAPIKVYAPGSAIASGDSDDKQMHITLAQRK